MVSLNPIPCQVEYWRHTAGVALDQSKLAATHLHFRSLLAVKVCTKIHFMLLRAFELRAPIFSLGDDGGKMHVENLSQ